MDRKPNPQGLQKGIVKKIDRQRGIGHATMNGSGLIVCIEISRFHETVSTGNSNKPWDVGEEKINCPSIRIGEKIIFYLPKDSRPGRKHPRPTRWALAQNGDRERKDRYRNDRGKCAGGCPARPQTRH